MSPEGEPERLLMFGKRERSKWNRKLL
ncbi:hypothetical protein EYF80_066593 [Liparis tanakae]|uniref:Uncharacterized protein n=1 Tax=Liparis tanakae TaxID=230148 RepID=A0A4Z2E3F1_9TELE|nr:hypothetical protein EYF80_066593 [Liparis tanakae]